LEYLFITRGRIDSYPFDCQGSMLNDIEMDTVLLNSFFLFMTEKERKIIEREKSFSDRRHSAGGVMGGIVPPTLKEVVGFTEPRQRTWRGLHLEDNAAVTELGENPHGWVYQAAGNPVFGRVFGNYDGERNGCRVWEKMAPGGRNYHNGAIYDRVRWTVAGAALFSS
jgi:hypothetical protein